jgi:hypothetical protein
MTNRSNISGNKPQQSRKPTPAEGVKSPGQIDTVKDMREVIKTPEQLDEHIRQQELEALDAEHYAQQGKVPPPPAQDELLVSSGDTGLKELAKTIDIARLEAAEEAVNHRSGMSYSELKAAYEEYKVKAEEAGEMLNAVRTVINNPFHRYGQFVDSIPLGRALKMEKVWQPKESR